MPIKTLTITYNEETNVINMDTVLPNVIALGLLRLATVQIEAVQQMEVVDAVVQMRIEQATAMEALDKGPVH